MGSEMCIRDSRLTAAFRDIRLETYYLAYLLPAEGYCCTVDRPHQSLRETTTQQFGIHTHTHTPRNNIMSFQDVGRSQRKPANAALSSSSKNSNHRVPDTWMGGSSSTSSGSIGQISESLTQYQVWSCNAREECACCGWKEISDATGKNC